MLHENFRYDDFEAALALKNLGGSSVGNNCLLLTGKWKLNTRYELSLGLNISSNNNNDTDTSNSTSSATSANNSSGVFNLNGTSEFSVWMAPLSYTSATHMTVRGNKYGQVCNLREGYV